MILEEEWKSMNEEQYNLGGMKSQLEEKMNEEHITEINKHKCWMKIQDEKSKPKRDFRTAEKGKPGKDS